MLSRFTTIFVRKLATKAGVVAPLSNRVFLFNYFEKPPLEEKEFVKNWTETSKYVQARDHFISLHLHNSKGPNTRFEWVNFVVCDSDDICIFGKPDPQWLERMKEGAKLGLTPKPGQYSEVASYNGNPLDAEPKERSETARFLITGVTADESISAEDMESNWKDWMKTDFIHQQLKGNNNLKDSMLYKLVRSPVPYFRYTVRTELSQMDEKEGYALADLVNQQKCCDGVETFTGFYSIFTNMFYKKE
ncbi:uncharacterized protein LOC120345041 [Styela clava]